MTKEQITKSLINLALIGCQRLNKQYQQYSKEIEEFTDHELFELISQYPTIHLKRISAIVKLIQRGYLLKEILDT